MLCICLLLCIMLVNVYILINIKFILKNSFSAMFNFTIVTALALTKLFQYSIITVLPRENLELFIPASRWNTIAYILRSFSSFKLNFFVDIFSFITKLGFFGIKLILKNLYTGLSVSFVTHVMYALPTISKLFIGATWAEREIFDLFGILFIGHTSLKRILTDYNLKGFPLLKNFPLSGYFEVLYSNTLKKLIYRPIKLSQDYRNFCFTLSV